MPPPKSEHFISERPRFSQIIFANTEGTLEKKIWIPRRFMRNCGREMSKYVQVKDPSGREWKLECSQSGGDTWFINGWQEFVDFYGLKHGHLLVFEYEGKSRFSVFIFDKSATEIMYPANGIHDFGDNFDEKLQKTKKKETMLDDLVIETSDDSSSSPKRRKASDSLRVHKMMRHNFRTKGEKLSYLAKQNKEVANTGNIKHLLGDRTAKAYERAKAFESKNPFVTVVIRPSFTHPKCQLYLPVSFSNDHFNKNQKDNAILYSGGRRWDVRFHMKKYNLLSFRLVFGIGWKKFHLENHLKVNDVCVWELTNKIDVTFKVHIYRVGEKTSTSASNEW